MNTQPRRPLEIIALVFLGLVGMVGLMGTLCSLAVPAGETGQSSVGLAPLCLGLVVGAGGGMLMLWRRRAKSAWWALSLAMGLWFVGALLLGLGSTAAVPTAEPANWATNVGLSVALCLVPGALMAAVGVVLYRYMDRLRLARRAGGATAVLGRANEMPGRASKLERAAEYRERIEGLVKQERDGAFSGQVASIIPAVDQWLAGLHRLAARLDAFDADPVIQRDIREIPSTISRLAAQVQAEADLQVRTQMQATLESCRQQQSQLQTLVSAMRQGDVEIDRAIAALGTLYSQLQLLGARQLDASRAERLRADAEEQVKQLDDLLSAVDDIYRRP